MKEFTMRRSVLTKFSYDISLVLPVLLLLASASSTLLRADDWPQWRGPNRDGKSAETGLLQNWPEGGPPLAWQADDLGGGYSSLSVAGGRIFTIGDLEDGQYVFAIEEKSGAFLWKSKIGEVNENQYAGSRSTPTADGDRLYVMSTEGTIVCLESATGNEVWRHSMPLEFDGYLMRAMGSYDWRFAESPLVDGNRVIVTPGHIGATMVALDKQTGETIWRTRGGRIGPIGADGAAYSSAVISQARGVRQYVQLVGRGVIGVDAESGEQLWSYNRVANDIANIATPLVHDDFVFSSTGYGTGAALVKIVASEDGAHQAEEVYFLEADTMQNHHGGLILHNGSVYTGTGHNKGFPLAVDFATGDVHWGPERNAGGNSAAIIYADGRLYFRYQNGRMILVEATPEAYREHGTFMIPNVEKESWSHPVIANGKLLLKEQGSLYAYDIAATNPSTGDSNSPSK
jgi:outer membrane protein assembly factor BamB